MGALCVTTDAKGGPMARDAQITTAEQAANDRLVLAFGWLQGAANRLEYILGRAIEQECGISHLMFEVLLILGRAGGVGMSMGAIAQERVLTTGGVTRLVDRMEAAGLVARDENPGDRRGRLVTIDPARGGDRRAGRPPARGERAAVPPRSAAGGASRAVHARPAHGEPGRARRAAPPALNPWSGRSASNWRDGNT